MKDIYKQAREFIRADKKPQAVQHLVQCICTDMNDYIAWDLVYLAVTNVIDKYAILQRLIKITPDDKTAFKTINNNRLQEFIKWAATQKIDLDKTNNLLIKDQIQKAKKLIANKELADAAVLLVPLVCADEKSAEIWWLLALTNPTLEQRRCQLERTVKLNPKLEDAQNMLKKLNELEYGRVLPDSETGPMIDANKEHQGSAAASQFSNNGTGHSSGSSYDDGIGMRPVGDLLDGYDTSSVERVDRQTARPAQKPATVTSTQTSDLKRVTTSTPVSDPKRATATQKPAAATSTQTFDPKRETTSTQASNLKPLTTSTQETVVKPTATSTQKTVVKPVIAPIQPDVPLEERLHTSSGMEWFSQDAQMSIRYKDDEILIIPLVASETDDGQIHIKIVDQEKDQFNGLYIAGEEVLVKGAKPTPIILPVTGKIGSNGRLQLTYKLPKPHRLQFWKKKEKSVKFDKVPTKDRQARRWIVLGLQATAIAAIAGLVLSKTVNIDKAIPLPQALLLGAIASVPFLYSLLVPTIKNKNYDELPIRVAKAVALFAALAVGVPAGLVLLQFALQVALFCLMIYLVIAFYPRSFGYSGELIYQIRVVLGMEGGGWRRRSSSGNSARTRAMEREDEILIGMQHQREYEEKARAEKEHQREMDDYHRSNEVHYPDVQY